MAKYKIEVEWDQIDSIMQSELKCALDQFKVDLITEDRMAIFDTDREVDNQMIQKHIESIELLLEYYGVIFR